MTVPVWPGWPKRRDSGFWSTTHCRGSRMTFVDYTIAACAEEYMVLRNRTTMAQVQLKQSAMAGIEIKNEMGTGGDKAAIQGSGRGEWKSKPHDLDLSGRGHL